MHAYMLARCPLPPCSDGGCTSYAYCEYCYTHYNLLPHIACVAFHLWGQPEVDLLASSHTNQSTVLHLGMVPTTREPWVECFQPPLDISSELVFPPALVPLVLSMFLMKHVTG